MAEPSGEYRQPWQLRLYAKSLMKKEKVRLLKRHLGHLSGKVFDLGCSQGVVSYQLRALGGTWLHADLDECNVVAARQLLGTEAVVLCTPTRLPVTDGSIDTVLALDFLEHVSDDRGVLAEVVRVLRPGGLAAFSTPIGNQRMWLNRLKRRVGLTPEIYGHVRHGYDVPELVTLLQAAGLRVRRATTYAKFFTELCELALNVVYARKRQKAGEASHRSGHISPSSAAELKPEGWLFRIYGAFVYPILYLLTRLDGLLWKKTGYATLVIAEKP